jgi:hypothetical protein
MVGSRKGRGANHVSGCYRAVDFGRATVSMLYLASPFTSIFAIFAYTQDGSHHVRRIFFDETEAPAHNRFAACSGNSPMEEAALEDNPERLDGAQ